MEPLPIPFAIAGGLLIGTAAALLLVLTGRIAGISGMVAAAARISTGGTPQGLAAVFLIGLPVGAALAAVLVRAPRIEVAASWPLLVAAGLLVGFGTRLGSGCTSGHGVCGLARLSPRSIVATATFMGAGFLTVFVARHLIGG